MDKLISVNELINKVRTSRFLYECALPMGYAAGYPIVKVRNGEGYLEIPFLRYKITGKVDQTLVFPIRATVTVRVRDGRIVGYRDLIADDRFAKVDFGKPIGLFRHDAVRGWNKDTYKAKKQELFALYDATFAAIAQGQEPDVASLAALLQIMVEPCQMPIYKALDLKFYQTYLDRG